MRLDGRCGKVDEPEPHGDVLRGVVTGGPTQRERRPFHRGCERRRLRSVGAEQRKQQLLLPFLARGYVHRGVASIVHEVAAYSEADTVWIEFLGAIIGADAKVGCFFAGWQRTRAREADTVGALG